MMSIVPAFSFSEPGLVNQLSDFQTGFTPWGFDCSDFLSTIHLKQVVLSPCSGESKTGLIKINTGFLGTDESLVGSIKTNSGSDVTDCFDGVPSPQSDELDSEYTRIQINTTNSGLIRTNTLSGESWIGSIKTNSGSAKIDTGYGESWIGSTKTNSGSDVIDCFNGVPSPQSNELDSENTRIGINVMNSDENARRKLNRPVSEVSDDRKRKRMESNRESARRSRMRKQRLIKNLEDEVNRLGLENRELNNRLRIVVYHIEKIRMDNNQLLSEQELLRRRFLEMRHILILRQLQQNMI